MSKLNKDVSLMKIARLGVLFDQHIAKEKWKNKEDSLSIYIGEILNHAGIHFEWIDSPKDIEASFDMIIIALIGEDTKSSQTILDYVQNGGSVISFHSNRSLASQLGFTLEEIDSPGYAHLDGYSQHDIPLRYLE